MEEKNVQLEAFAKQLAIARNNLEMAKVTLRQLSLKAVVFNRELLNQISPTSALRVDNLPLVLKDDLLDMMMQYDMYHNLKSSEMDVCCKFMMRLLHQHTSRFCMPEFHYLSQHETLLDVVARRCQGLRFLDAGPPLSAVNDQSDSYKPLILRALSHPQLATLQIMNLDLRCSDSDLQLFAMHTPHLVILQVASLDEDVSSIGFQALSTMLNLLKFLFYQGTNWMSQQKFLLMCAKFLPQLQIVGSLHHYDVDTDAYHKPLLEQEQPIQLGLQEVVMMGEVRFHPTCKLPNLQRMLLFNPTGDVLGLVQRFPGLTELFLSKLEIKVIIDVLKEVGRQLIKLEILETRSLSLPDIMQLCPNAKYLDLNQCRLNEFYGTWPNNLFSNLETFRLKCTKTFKPLPSGFMKQLMGAPRLQDVIFWNVYLTEPEVDDLLTLTREKLILQNLVSLQWLNWHKVRSWMAQRVQLKLLLDTIQVAVPGAEIHTLYK